MKRLKIITFFLIFLTYSAVVFAAQKKDKEIPPWMEDVKAKGRSTYLVPKGAKREIIGAHVVVEPPNEYVARRIYEMEGYMEERFNKMTEDQESIKKELKELKEIFIGIEIKKELENLRESVEKIEKKREIKEERKLEELKEMIKAMEMEMGIEEQKDEITP